MVSLALGLVHIPLDLRLVVLIDHLRLSSVTRYVDWIVQLPVAVVLVDDSIVLGLDGGMSNRVLNRDLFRVEVQVVSEVGTGDSPH